MRKKALIILAMLILPIAISFTSIAQSVPPEVEYKMPPVILIHSPTNGTFSSNRISLSITITKPEIWLIHGGYNAQQILKSINYQVDGQHYNQIPINNTLESPFHYSITLTNLTDGNHSLQVYAYATGWVIQMNGLYEYEIPINSSSDMVFFRIDTSPPTISELSIANQTYNNQTIPLSFSTNEKTSWLSYALDNHGNVTIKGNTTLTGLDYGSHSLAIYANDTLGNMGKTDVYFEVKKEDFTSQIIIGIIAVIIIGSGLLVYFKKYHKKKLANK